MREVKMVSGEFGLRNGFAARFAAEKLRPVAAVLGETRRIEPWPKRVKDGAVSARGENARNAGNEFNSDRPAPGNARINEAA